MSIEDFNIFDGSPLWMFSVATSLDSTAAPVAVSASTKRSWVLSIQNMQKYSKAAGWKSSLVYDIQFRS